ncbi:uncharacterized protein STEHIDRAFT_89201 [Stereum hirsutum FP-91666 SS1]|uniref:uncharacterized protein n=1 Tax=Stereum hirsutum (strain FP-91666) TaxID=721885 RepID=UPI000440C7F1|nr:uncharacterized protein STEHIDRAFT_89201 [Stereum hirsutum FP-91666 SS1]EIM92298.1 hypothetical protein STEHIDRAFT_89201 [Stereum hirsutum FP-91666 SS1]
MPPDSSKQLTKKQKKALAFRERSGKPGKSGSSRTSKREDEILDVPVSENLDEAEAEADGAAGADAEVHEVSKPKEVVAKGKGKGKEKARKEGDVTKDETKSKKRKRDGEADEGQGENGDGEVEGKEGKKAANADGEGAAGSEDRTKEDAKDKTKQRFILFVGNLKYTTSKEAIQQHFAICDPPPTIRLLSPKQTRPGAPTAKSKGCAFLEFTSRNALQQALKLHHSELESRKINVELTAGGGGKSESRLTKLQTRNKELASQREKRMQKAVADGEQVAPDRPQRYSTTSGEGQASAGKRTWTVGDVDDGETHRGGKNAKKKVRGVRTRPQGTGVNAIPVG